MRRGIRVAALWLLSVNAVWAGPEPKGVWAFANPDAVPSQRPRGLDGAALDRRMFPRQAPPLAVGFAAGAYAPAPGERGLISTPSLPHRTFSTQQQVAEALELARASLELRAASSVVHALQLLAAVEGRLGVAGNRERISTLRTRVQALADAAAPRRERAWPSVRHVLLSRTTAWLSQAGKTP